MTFNDLLSALTNNPTALNHYNGLIAKMLENGATIISTSKNGGVDFYNMETVFSNDCQIDLYFTAKYDGSKEIAVAQYSNISDKFWTDCDDAWTFQQK